MHACNSFDSNTVRTLTIADRVVPLPPAHTKEQIDLFYACKKNDLPEVRRLLKRNVSSHFTYLNTSPFGIAIQNQNLDLENLLLSKSRFLLLPNNEITCVVLNKIKQDYPQLHRLTIMGKIIQHRELNNTHEATSLLPKTLTCLDCRSAIPEDFLRGLTLLQALHLSRVPGKKSIPPLVKAIQKLPMLRVLHLCYPLDKDNIKNLATLSQLKHFSTIVVDDEAAKAVECLAHLQFFQLGGINEFTADLSLLKNLSGFRLMSNNEIVIPKICSASLLKVQITGMKNITIACLNAVNLQQLHIKKAKKVVIDDLNTPALTTLNCEEIKERITLVNLAECEKLPGELLNILAKNNVKVPVCVCVKNLPPQIATVAGFSAKKVEDAKETSFFSIIAQLVEVKRFR